LIFSGAFVALQQPMRHGATMAFLSRFIDLYEQGITWVMWLVFGVGPDKLMHTWVGLGIWLLAALALRCPLRDWRPLAVLAVLEGANEVVDYIHAIGWTVSGTLGDVFTTFFWPVVLGLALRVFPVLRD